MVGMEVDEALMEGRGRWGGILKLVGCGQATQVCAGRRWLD